MTEIKNQKFILYDIPSSLEPKFWSLNTLKTRILLNFKGIPFETKWVPFPDIQQTLEQLGVTPLPGDGSKGPLYTLPALTHENKTIMGSDEIRDYLEKIAPSPTVFPTEKSSAFTKPISEYMSSLTGTIFPAMMGLLPTVLGERDIQYLAETRSKWWGLNLADCKLSKELMDSTKTKLEAELESNSLLDLKRLTNDNIDFKFKSGKYLFGDELCYADILFCSTLYPIESLFNFYYQNSDDDKLELDSWTKEYFKNMKEFIV